MPLASKWPLSNQNNSLRAGYDALELALQNNGIAIISRGVFEVNTDDVQPGLDDIVNASINPQAIVMVSQSPWVAELWLGGNFPPFGQVCVVGKDPLSSRTVPFSLFCWMRLFSARPSSIQPLHGSGKASSWG